MSTGPNGIDLARADIGGMVIAANDEFFAAKENLILPTEPAFDPGDYYDRGKRMDGWETRRRRVKGYDWAVIRLGVPGIIDDFIIDTAHFTGNYPPGAMIEGAWIPGYPSPAEVLSDDVTWVPLTSKEDLQGDHKNPVTPTAKHAVTHLRLNIYPDGGVARLRCFGRPIAAWSKLGPQPDLASAVHGARVIAVSDEFYGVRHNVLMPGRAAWMRDGWEVRRRRDDGHDWCLIRLAIPGRIHRAEIDTNHFKGNCPGEVRIEAARHPGAIPDDPNDIDWTLLLPKFRVQPHTQHLVGESFPDAGPFDLVRVCIFPDGGISRLRLWGPPDPDALSQAGVERLNAMLPETRRRILRDCCGSDTWVDAMQSSAPWSSVEHLLDSADSAWSQCDEPDWLQAFSHHPRIGDRKAAEAQSDAAAALSAQEQSATQQAEQSTLDELARLNHDYELRFGFTYIVRAAGRSADEMLELLKARLANDRGTELITAAAQQHQITRLRLEKSLS